jgi:transposase
MLRLLKLGAYRSRRALSDVLGYSERHLQRWFDAYRTGGLAALLAHERPRGRSERITPEAWAALEKEMKAGRIASLKEAQRFLGERFSTRYTLGGLSDLFRRRKAKLKTGRRRNKKASSDEQAAFKKPVRGGGPEAAPGAVLRP